MKEQWKRLDGDAKLILNVEEGRSVPVNIEFPLSTIIRKKESCCRNLLTFLKVLVLVVILSVLSWYATFLYTNFNLITEGFQKDTRKHNDPFIGTDNELAFERGIYKLDPSNVDGTTEKIREILYGVVPVIQSSEEISSSEDESEIEFFKQLKKPIQQIPNQGQVDNFVENSEKPNIVTEILKQNEKLIQKDSQLDGESNNERTDSETSMLDVKENNSGATFLDVLLSEILEVNDATEKNDENTALLEPSNDYVKGDPKFDRTDEINDEEDILDFLRSIGLFNSNNEKDVEYNKEELADVSSEKDEIISEKIIDHRQENAFDTEDKSENGNEEKSVEYAWIKHLIGIVDEPMSFDKNEFSDGELNIEEKEDESEENEKSISNYSSVKTESSEKSINYSTELINKASGEIIASTFAPDEFLKMWDNLNKEHRMESVVRYLEPIVGRRYELLSWYLNNKNCLNVENDKLKCHIARSLYNTDVSEFYDDLRYVITLLDNVTLTRSSDSDDLTSISDSNIRSHILNTLVLKKYVKDMLEADEFDDNTAQWALEDYIGSLLRELELYSEEHEENDETIREKGVDETATQSISLRITETGTLNNQLSDENTNDYDVELKNENTALAFQEPGTVPGENTDLLKLINKSQISKNSDELDQEHVQVSVQDSHEYGVELSKENIKDISKDPEALATRNQKSLLNDYLEPDHHSANNDNESTITDERRNDDKPIYDSVENMSSSGQNQQSHEIDEPTIRDSNEDSQEIIPNLGLILDSRRSRDHDNDGDSSDFLSHSIYYGDNYDNDYE